HDKQDPGDLSRNCFNTKHADRSGKQCQNQKGQCHAEHFGSPSLKRKGCRRSMPANASWVGQCRKCKVADRSGSRDFFSDFSFSGSGGFFLFSLGAGGGLDFGAGSMGRGSRGGGSLGFTAGAFCGGGTTSFGATTGGLAAGSLG